MMTVAKLSAGDGYEYYLSETVSADVRREPGRELGDYYLAEGLPQGVWMGAGRSHLGLDGEVTEAQMKALYGEGIHPDAARMVAEATAGISDPAEVKRAITAALQEAKLGRKYYAYSQPDGSTLTEAMREGLARFERVQHRKPSVDERRVIRSRVAHTVFKAEHGRDAGSAEEMTAWIKGRQKPAQQAVAGYDLQFAPAKTVSVLWAIGDEDTRKAVEAAHEAGIEKAVAFIEERATATRAGYNGIAQLDVDGGVIASRFRHYDSRTGDPQLHDHVVVSTKVKSADGKWRSLDGQLLYQLGVPASEVYNAEVMAQVCARLGVAAAEHVVTPGKRPVMEIAGVDPRLATAWSSRSQSVKDRTSELVAAYRAEHGRAPDAKLLIKLAQRATIETRPTKSAARSLRDLRQVWRQAAVEVVGPAGAGQVLKDARRAAKKQLVRGPVDVEQAAREVSAVVENARTVWGRHHMEAEAHRWVSAHYRGRPAPPDLVDVITERALTGLSLPITAPAAHAPFAPLTRADGESIYVRKESNLYTSERVLAAEDRVLVAARTSVLPAVSGQTFDRVLAQRSAEPGAQTDAGQIALARAFATSDRLLVAGIGPAGAGKTTALALVGDAVRAQGRQVVGLAPSAKAAAIMAAELDTPALTLHAWLRGHEGLLGARQIAEQESTEHGPASRQARRALAQVAALVEFDLHAGDVLIVDEAGMAGTARLAAVVEHAERAGAHVRLIGDPAQLAAIESGGALRLVAHEVGAIELESVWRFGTNGEAAASLMLRDGTTSTQLGPADAANLPTAAPVAAGTSTTTSSDPFDWYRDQGRIIAGTDTAMLDAVFTAWTADVTAGKTSLMMASETATVRELNTRAQAHAAAAGQITGLATVALRDEAHAGIGDIVVTRRNNRAVRLHGGRDFVKNGDTWQLTQIHHDGSIDVIHQTHGAHAHLDADYVNTHIELGYAATIHRGQGATVDTAHVILTNTSTREGAYVGLTRGRESNRAYVVTATSDHDAHGAPTPPLRRDDVLAAIAGRVQQSQSAHELIRAEQDRPGDLVQLAAEYNDVAERADAQRLAALVHAVFGPTRGAAFTTAPAWPGMARSLREGQDAGWSPERLLKAADLSREWTPCEDVAAVMSSRIDGILEAAAAQERRDTEPEQAGKASPLIGLTQDQLEKLAATAEQALKAAFAEANLPLAQQAPRVVRARGVEHPAWPNRPHGPQRTADLAATIATARTAARGVPYSDQQAREAAWATYRHLRDEQTLRRQIGPGARAAEDAQRTHHVATHVTVAGLSAAGAPLEAGAPDDARDATALLVSAELERRILDATRTHPATTSPEHPSAGEHTRLVEVTAASDRFYRDHLAGSWAQTYLADRLGQAAGDPRFSAGYAPNGWTTLVEHLRGAGYTDAEMLAAGVARTTRDGRLIDQMRDRLVFALRDVHHRDVVVGFTGRRNPSAPDDERAGPKYINTPTTALYDKSTHLYGIAEATHGPHQVRADARPVLVEGPLDAWAITAASDGTAFGVAPLGTSLTDTHIDHLTPHLAPDRAGPAGIVVATDADTAGRKAAQRAFWKLTNRGSDPQHLPLPDGLDPADVHRTHGPAHLAHLLATTTPLATTLITDITNDIDHTNVAAKVYAARAAARIAVATPPRTWADHLKQISTGLDVLPETTTSAAAAAAADYNASRQPSQHAGRPASQPVASTGLPGDEQSRESAPVRPEGDRRMGSAKARAHRARVVHARISAEQRRRAKLPDHPPMTPAPDALPEWVAPSRAVTDPLTPAPWREHLRERREYLMARLVETGEHVAAIAPAWSQDLGPVPGVDTPERQEWVTLAAQVDLWRRQHSIGDDVTEAVPHHPDDATAEQLRDRITAQANAGRAAAAAAATVEAPRPAQDHAHDPATAPDVRTDLTSAMAQLHAATAVRRQEQEARRKSEQLARARAEQERQRHAPRGDRGIDR